MSNLIPTNIQIPAHLANRIGKPSALAASLAGGIGGGESFPRISIKGARFRIVEGGNETVLDSTSLDVVIVGANPKLSKTWYAKTWNAEDKPAAPDCFSLDGVRPHPEAVLPQHDLCASCPQNAWGSKITPQGREIKACADQKRLAVVAADDPSGPIYLLQVTPAALKDLNAYQKELSLRAIAPEIVKTRISFDTNASFPKLTFKFGGFLDEATMGAVDELFGSPRVLEITGEKSASVLAEVEEAAPAPKPMLISPKPAVVEESAAPKRGFGAKTAAPATTAAKPTKVAKPAPAKEPEADTNALADEIAALVSGLGMDDE